MTAENAKSLMKVMYNNHITSHPHHIISQTHQTVNVILIATTHNTDYIVQRQELLYPHAMWTNVLTLTIPGTTQHTSSPPHYTPYAGNSISF